MKIHRIIINNFRGFQHADFELQDFNCIIGQNDSGKSTIFAAVDWFFSNNKELAFYDIHSNVRDDQTEISVEIYFSESTPLLPRYLEKEFIDKEGLIYVKKTVANRQFEDSDFVKPIPYYALRVFKFDGRKELLSFCTLEDLMKECIDIGIQKEFFTERLLEFQNSTDYRRLSFRAKYGYLIPLMQEALYGYYYTHDYHIVEDFKLFPESKWYKWLYEDAEFFLPSFVLYTPHTPINFYLNKLFNNYFSIFEDKQTEEISKRISDSIDDHIFIEKITSFYDSNYFPTNSLTPIITGNNLEMIPLQNRGDGFQQKVKNAVFRLYAEEGKTKSEIYAFEEPETHLHPSAQIKMYETIKRLSEKYKYQVIITTHSPYIVKELAKDKITPIVITRDTQKQVSHISNLSDRVLPYVSMNEINYIAFDEPSIEYHIELFGFLQNKLIDKYENDTVFKNDWDTDILAPNRNGVLCPVSVYTIKGVDIWFAIKICANKYTWYDTNNFTMEKRTMPYCVRNNIDHPLTEDDKSDINKHRAFVNNAKFIKYIKKSIEIMRDAIINNPLIFR